MFEAIFVPQDLRDAVSDGAWLQAMLEAERALAVAGARTGVIPAAAAEAVAAACRADLFDVEELAAQGRAVGNPAEPLVRALRAAVGEDAADSVHFGATSQDVVDTAAMLVARRALDLVLAELAGLASACAALADAHRGTVMAGRTLLQQAVPTTFGLKAGGWLAGVVEARRRLAAIRRDGLAVQLGGAAGTLAPLGERGLEVLRLYAQELGLAEPALPWHTNRVRVAELGAALDIAAGAAAKVALDVALLAQTEVGETLEPAGGASSTMPQKRNPVRSTLALACARRVHAAASLLTGGLAQEHERAIGAWHAEWEALSSALALTGGAAAAAREATEGLEVHPERMRANLSDALMAERASFALAERVGRARAHELVAAAAARGSLRELDVPVETFDPASYLGSADAFVDRALALLREDE